MNGKKAKKIRRAARVITAGLPLRNTQTLTHVNPLTKVQSYRTVNDPKTFRGAYRYLKRAATFPMIEALLKAELHGPTEP